MSGIATSIRQKNVESWRHVPSSARLASAKLVLSQALVSIGIGHNDCGSLHRSLISDFRFSYQTLQTFSFFVYIYTHVHIVLIHLTLDAEIYNAYTSYQTCDSL